MPDNTFVQYATIRKDYIQQLDEEGFLTRDRLIKPDLLDPRRIPIRDSPMEQFCQENPDNPLCHRIAPEKEFEQLIDVHSGYLDRLDEAGLLGVRDIMVDLVGWCGTPPTIWPGPFPWGDGSPVPIPFQEEHSQLMDAERTMLF